MKSHPVDGGASALKDDLLRPEAYAPLATAQTVDLVETHISWVFLLDRDVFKVKKPLNLGFLDFRTLEQRRAACEAEVTLNRRLAAHVYRGVVALRRSDDGRLSIGGSGPVVDYAVHMLRLPDAARADQLLMAGALRTGMVDAIGRRIGAFHASCRSDAATARFGSLAVIEANLAENFAQTGKAVARYIGAIEAEALEHWQRAFLREHAGLFERRAAEGRVRDGHGDLRLEHVYFDHVYLDDGPATIIDCIEFNERFRFADVCADIAFLSMDLAAHGRVDLAERLLAAYARETNDYDLYALVDFYESYRAFVRGKIAAMLAADPSVDAAARHRADAEARAYFLLALSATRPSMLRPAVLAVGGFIGSGKSTVADHLGSAMSAPVVDADRTRKAMLGVPATHPMEAAAWAGAYRPEVSENVYGEVMRRAGVVLASGRSIIIDASFRSSAMRDAAKQLARQQGVPFRFIECQAPADVCRARLADREKHASVSDGRLAIFDAFCAQFEPVRELSSQEHIVVDTSQPLDHTATLLRARLDVCPPEFVA